MLVDCLLVSKEKNNILFVCYTQQQQPKTKKKTRQKYTEMSFKQVISEYNAENTTTITSTQSYI